MLVSGRCCLHQAHLHPRGSQWDTGVDALRRGNRAGRDREGCPGAGNRFVGCIWEAGGRLGRFISHRKQSAGLAPRGADTSAGQEGRGSSRPDGSEGREGGRLKVALPLLQVHTVEKMLESRPLPARLCTPPCHSPEGVRSCSGAEHTAPPKHTHGPSTQHVRLSTHMSRALGMLS